MKQRDEKTIDKKCARAIVSTNTCRALGKIGEEDPILGAITGPTLCLGLGECTMGRVIRGA